GRRVEQAIGPERQPAAVVIAARMRNRDERLAGVGFGDVRIVAHAMLGDSHRAVARRVIDEEAAGMRIVRVKGEAEQAALSAEADPVAYIEERRLAHRAVGKDANSPALLDDEE